MYRKTILDNGIRVVTEQLPGVRSISLGVLLAASLAEELPTQGGLAHLSEHALFQGTHNRDAWAIGRMMDLAGGGLGGMTTRDYTCLYGTVLDDHRTYAFELFGDLLTHAAFPADRIEHEKQVVQQEIAGLRDAPGQRVQSQLKQAVWPQHHLGRPLEGTHESVEQLTRQDVVQFCADFYSPARMLVAVAGPVVHEELVAQAQDAFWKIQGPPGRRPLRPAPFAQHWTWEPATCGQTYFAIGIAAVPYTHADRAVMHVISQALGGGMSSRLFRRLREQSGLVYQIHSEYQPYAEAGLLVVAGNTSPHQLPAALGQVLLELWQLGLGELPLSEEELWVAKVQLRGQHLLASEDTATRMSRLATQEFYFGEQVSAATILAELDAVDATAVARFSEAYLATAVQQATVALVGPVTAALRREVEQVLADFGCLAGSDQSSPQQ